MAQTMGMSKPRGQLIQEIFEQASALSAGERVAWMHERCGEDERLRDLVLGLLEQGAGSDAGLGQSVDQAIAGAATAFAQAESIARESIPPTDKRNVQVLLESARLSLARKQAPAAITAARAALALIDEQDPGRMTMIQCVLAEALASTGEVAEARDLLNRALGTRRRTMPAEHWMVADTERQLAAL
jgi:hypothetical protein